MTKFVISYGMHPNEVLAFHLAPKIAKILRTLGNDAHNDRQR